MGKTKIDWVKRRQQVKDLLEKGLNYAEIGEVLGITRQSVYVLVLTNGMKTPKERRIELAKKHLTKYKI